MFKPLTRVFRWSDICSKQTTRCQAAQLLVAIYSLENKVDLVATMTPAFVPGVHLVVCLNSAPSSHSTRVSSYLLKEQHQIIHHRCATVSQTLRLQRFCSSGPCCSESSTKYFATIYITNVVLKFHLHPTGFGTSRPPSPSVNI